MTARVTLASLAVLAICAALWAAGVISPRFAPADAALDDCTTCDARQDGKARLRERLKATRTDVE